VIWSKHSNTFPKLCILFLFSPIKLTATSNHEISPTNTTNIIQIWRWHGPNDPARASQYHNLSQHPFPSSRTKGTRVRPWLLLDSTGKPRWCKLASTQSCIVHAFMLVTFGSLTSYFLTCLLFWDEREQLLLIWSMLRRLLLHMRFCCWILKTLMLLHLWRSCRGGWCFITMLLKLRFLTWPKDWCLLPSAGVSK